MKISEAGKKFLIEREGERLDVYKDSIGIPTIGVGHVIHPGDPLHITREEEFVLLDKDLEPKEAAVNSLVKVPLNQNQFDALVSFTFNLGEHSLQISTLLRKLNAGDFGGAADEFLKWDMAGGKVSEGLETRREKERCLFLT